ncbi:P-loop containing nucleoside triphosphate hydrolase protein [Pelagophyceae sp. CCMP2097]|nr:P-loop containing nucleoside triphosphate hydrolase protein [Pelagophyceae sp. CCMP2097]
MRTARCGGLALALCAVAEAFVLSVRRPTAPPRAVAETDADEASIRGLVDARLLANLDKQLGAGWKMTPVQKQAFLPLMGSEDVVAKAQTGTGKTVAFLLPLLAKVVQQDAAGRRRAGVRVLVLSPTRELAQQIEAQAKRLVDGAGLRVGCVVGGLSKSRDEAMLTRGVEVLVATPGRLCDLLDSPRFGGCLSQIDALVLDEGDRLLDQGFEKELRAIIRACATKRQTACFSATLGPNLERLLEGTISAGHARIDCGSSAVETASRVVLFARALGRGADYCDALHAALVAHDATGPAGSKAVVFCQTTSQAELVAAYLTNRGLRNVVALHSRKSQPQRSRISEAFRDAAPAQRAVLVATDVAARGVDYPGVTFVVQLGAPTNSEQFVHRAGRTGRAGNAGVALLLLEAWEAKMAKAMLYDVKGIKPLEMLWAEDAAASRAAMRDVGLEVRERTYTSWLGHMSQYAAKLKWDKRALVDNANEMALNILLLDTPPPLTAKAAAMMGLKGLVAIEKGPRGDGPPPRRGAPARSPGGPATARPKSDRPGDRPGGPPRGPRPTAAGAGRGYAGGAARGPPAPWRATGAQ